MLMLLPPDGQFAPTQLRGRVVWASSRETGVELLDPSPELQRLLALSAARWDLVRDIEHRGDCACAQRELASGQRQP
jgi:hypothetical protein